MSVAIKSKNMKIKQLCQELEEARKELKRFQADAQHNSALEQAKLSHIEVQKEV